MSFIDKIKKKFIVGKLSVDILKNAFILTKKGKTGNVDHADIEQFNETETQLTEQEIDIIFEDVVDEKSDVELPDYEPTLSKGFLAGLQGAFYTPAPLLSKKTILDKSMKELLDIGVEEVGSILMSEITNLENFRSKVRNEQLQRIFASLFRFQTTSEYARKYGEDEQRFYAELIATPGFLTNSFVRDFLKSGVYSSNYGDYRQIKLIEKISDFYISHSKEEIEKFNYVFMTSDAFSIFLLDNEVDLNSYFTSGFLAAFDKEDLSLICRFYMNNDNLYNLVNPQNEKALFLISAMTKQVKSVTGHSVEFIDSVFRYIDDPNFIGLLNSFYDELVVDKSNESSFLQALSEKNFLQEFTDYMIRNHYQIDKLERELYGSYVYDSPFLNINSWSDFGRLISEDRASKNRVILGNDFFRLVTEQKESTIPKLVLTEESLYKFKEALLGNLYGITLDDAEYFSKAYGQHLSELLRGIPPRNGMSDAEYLASLDESKMTIKKEDLMALQLLQAIDNIVKVDINDPKVEEKVEMLQIAYLKQLKAKGIDYRSPYASFAVVEGILNNMYINTYNKRLTPASQGELIEVVNGVQVLDAGLEFDMIVTSLNGVGNFFDEKVNMASKWNTASLASKHGICTSYINAQNIGVINLTAPFLVFPSIPKGGLDAMGTSDIWTTINNFNLRMTHRAGSSNRRFVPGSIMGDETRYGYNEILVDRFLSTSKDGDFKLQPGYIMYFKCNDEYRDDPVYEGSLQMAKDFGIPLKIVDVPKLKEHERETINSMCDKLFSSDDVDDKLFQDIVTRYMNNYTGSLAFVGSGKYEEDFSVEGMRMFFNNAYIKASSLEDKEKAKKWIMALEKAYSEEKRRYDEARMANEWSYSVGDFVLETYKVEEKITALKKKCVYVEDDEIDFSVDFSRVGLSNGAAAAVISDSTLDPGLRTLIGFKNSFGLVNNLFYEPVYDEKSDRKSHIVHFSKPYKKDAHDFVLESLVFSYLTGSMKDHSISVVYGGINPDTSIDLNNDQDFELIDNLAGSFYQKVKFGSPDFVMDSSKVNKIISKVESMDDKAFLQIFKPIIEKKSKETGMSFEELSNTLLDRKNTIRENFEKFERFVNPAKADGTEKKDETGRNI